MVSSRGGVVRIIVNWDIKPEAAQRRLQGAQRPECSHLKGSVAFQNALGV
jgi:hypothetical protein